MTAQPPIAPTGPFADLPSDEPAIPHFRSRRRSGRERPRIGLNITPMIDVVFLLLVYFMVATSFKLGEEVYRLDLPERGTAAEPDPFQLDTEPLRIAVLTTGPGDVAYRIHLDGPYEQPSTFGELADFLHQRRIGPGSPAGLFAPDHPVIIEPGAATRWEHVMGAFNAAARARYTNLTLGPPT